MNRNTLSVTILFVLYLLMFWSDLLTFRPGMDAMTFGGVAKNILDTGNWATLHYTDQAYPSFYQHPPLPMWMMAISMQVIEWIAGPAAARADWVLKPLPSIVAGIGVMLVYIWARRMRGEWFAFLATFVLLTSTRYVKYSKGFMLDPFLTTFSIGSIYAAVKVSASSASRPALAAGSGFLVAAAFLSKGLFAFAPLLLCLLILRRRALPFFAGFAALIVPWLTAGGGVYYIERYFAESVASHMNARSLAGHIGPIRNLIKVYWPWLPFFIWGSWKIVRTYLRDRKTLANEISRLDQSLVVPLLAALFFIGGFCSAGSFLEQYHVATYPFLAFVVAYAMFDRLEKYRLRIEKGLLVVLGVVGIAFVISPQIFRSTEYKNPIRLALQEARSTMRDLPNANSIRRITISTGVAEIWYALAMGIWNTEWDARSASAMESPEDGNSQLLLAASNEPVASGWIETNIRADGVRIYRSNF